MPFTPWLQSTRVNLIEILLFPTPTRHNRLRIYLRSLSPVEGFRNTLGLKAWVGLQPQLFCCVLLTCPSLSASLTSTGHTLTACPLPPPPPAQLFIHNFLPPGSNLILQPASPISFKRHGQRLQLNPRSLGNSLTPTCFLLAPHPENALTWTRWMLQWPATGMFSNSHPLSFCPEPVYPGEFCLP